MSPNPAWVSKKAFEKPIFEGLWSRLQSLRHTYRFHHLYTGMDKKIRFVRGTCSCTLQGINMAKSCGFQLEFPFPGVDFRFSGASSASGYVSFREGTIRYLIREGACAASLKSWHWQTDRRYWGKCSNTHNPSIPHHILRQGMSGVISAFFGDNDVASSSKTYKPSNSKV